MLLASCSTPRTHGETAPYRDKMFDLELNRYWERTQVGAGQRYSDGGNGMKAIDPVLLAV